MARRVRTSNPLNTTSNWSTSISSAATARETRKIRELLESQKMAPPYGPLIHEHIYAIRAGHPLPDIGPDPKSIALTRKLPRDQQREIGMMGAVRRDKDVRERWARREDWEWLARFQDDYGAGRFRREDALAVLQSRA